ncbi:MAG: hypothetical protein V3V85_00590 [Candidatus Thorarchaeota archaeon]
MVHKLQDILAIPIERLAQASKVGVEILPDTRALHQHFARSIADEIKRNNELGQPTCLILPVGPTAHYPLLAEICNKERISWNNTYTFNMDEYLDWQGRPIPLDHPMSFEGFMREHLFDRLAPNIRIPEDHISFPHPFRVDEISGKIEEVGGVDICYGGIGYHGHIAFNEPPNTRWYTISEEEFKRSATRVVPLAPDTIVVNSMAGAGGYSPGGNSEEVPPMAVTLGMKDILNSRAIRLYCDGGDWQRTIFRIAVLGEKSVDYPVTFIQDHPDTIVYADANTARGLHQG